MESFSGRSILVSFNYYSQGNRLVRRAQFLGKVAEASGELILVISPEGKEYRLPPDYRALLDAPRGEYKSLVTSETITNPDLLMSWKIILPADPDEEPEQWLANYSPHFQSIVPPEWRFTHWHDGEHWKDLIERKREAYVGKRILIGLAYYGEDDGEVRSKGQEQLYGTIVRVSYEEGIMVALGDGQELNLPPDLTMLQPAPRGEYKLRSTGETVANPDLVTIWTINQPADEEGE